MSCFTDPSYLRDEQYRDDSNLRARVELHERFSTNPEAWHRWVFDRLEPGPQADVLEIGCGAGELWRQNLERIPREWRLMLADLSPGMLDAARAAVGDRAEYRVADVRELPFPDDSFDAAIANHMLYHVPDRARALAELRRVLRPEGRFYASTNGVEHLREIKALLAEQWGWEFRLEAAAAELLGAFVDVELDVYPCDLEVTEAEPLVAFVRSLDHGEIEGMEEVVRATIEREGSFHVTKSTGLFRCRKP